MTDLKDGKADVLLRIPYVNYSYFILAFIRKRIQQSLRTARSARFRRKLIRIYLSSPHFDIICVQKSKERALEKSDKIARSIRNAGGLPCTAPKLVHRPLDAKMFKKSRIISLGQRTRSCQLSEILAAFVFPKECSFSFMSTETNTLIQKANMQNINKYLSMIVFVCTQNVSRKHQYAKSCTKSGL